MDYGFREIKINNNHLLHKISNENIVNCVCFFIVHYSPKTYKEILLNILHIVQNSYCNNY